MSFYFTAEEESLMDSVRYQTSREFEHLKKIKANVNTQFQELCKMQKRMREDAETWKQERRAAEIALEIINEQGIRENQKLVNLRKECVLVKRKLRNSKKEFIKREELKRK